MCRYMGSGKFWDCVSPLMVTETAQCPLVRVRLRNTYLMQYVENILLFGNHLNIQKETKNTMQFLLKDY